MNVRPLERDEAKGVRWEVSVPSYRVDFWRHLADELPDTPPEKVGYERDSYHLSDVTDVEEVLEWARANQGEKSYVIHVMVQSGTEAGTIRLHGIDPTVPVRSGATTT
jgi:hypothetical protein